jgi:hypothetical protein
MFTTLMNSIFHERLDEFMIIYIDDILVYSKIAKEHAEKSEYALSKLRENKLFVNGTKNESLGRRWSYWGISCHGKG